MKKWHKSLLVGIGAVVLSTVAIQASDVMRGVSGNMASLAVKSEGPCSAGSTLILLGAHSLCVDTYEASAGENCPNKVIDNAGQTQENANNANCSSVSKKGNIPWNFISLTQAQQICARSGKRLPTNEEWYKMVSGQTDQSNCVTHSKEGKPSPSGMQVCTTPAGLYDMIGNVWEWIDGQVTNGNYNNHQLPETGYVTLVDANGVVVNTSANPSLDFGSDYAITNTSGIFGIIRGGFYASGDDAGIFAQNLAVPLDFKSVGVGFRCVKDI